MNLSLILRFAKFLIQLLEENGISRKAAVNSFVENDGLDHKAYLNLIGEIRELGVEIHADKPRPIGGEYTLEGERSPEQLARAADEEEQMRAIAAEAVAEHERQVEEERLADIAQQSQRGPKKRTFGWFRK